MNEELLYQLKKERDLWKEEAERWRYMRNHPLQSKIQEMRGQMNGTYGAGRGWEAALDEIEKFLNE